jgi:PAS domain S-box-containing protein
MRDISERKQSEILLDRERRMLRTLIDNLPDIIYVKDTDCRKVIANKADVMSTGFGEEKDVLGKTDIELYPGNKGLRGYESDLEVITTGERLIEHEENFIDKNGVNQWFLTTKIPLHDNDGKVTGLVGVDHNVTERKLAEERLQQSYAFNESLLKTIPFGMDIVDEEGTVLFQSENFRRIFGENAIGMKCWELYRDDKMQCNDCPLTRGIRIGETEAYESHGVLDNRIFEINHTGMMYEGKKAMLEIFQDITERKENEQELIRAKEKAEESDRLKTAFLHNISHEIRTPMNAIVGFSTLLGEPDIDEQTRQSYTEVIMQSSNQLLSIISDIVDISNIEADLVKLVKSEVNLNSVLKKLFNQFKIKADEKKLGLTYITDLPDSEASIMTDSTKLIQIISNLLSNAFKFTSKGFVKFGYTVKNDHLEFFVSDSGIGIPVEYHSKVFDRFYQVENLKSRIYEGTGLGLAISKAYVDLLGGTIWISTETGTANTGTTFFFTIPFTKQGVKTVPDSVSAVPESFVFPEEKMILVVEDIDSNFKLIQYFLSRANVRILRASNGKEAIEKAFEEKNLDLILMDIKMPVMDGYTATKLIREKNSLIPIIVQTAYSDEKEKAFECGCSGFISKPFDKKGLIKIICEYI